MSRFIGRTDWGILPLWAPWCSLHSPSRPPARSTPSRGSPPAKMTAHLSGSWKGKSLNMTANDVVVWSSPLRGAVSKPDASTVMYAHFGYSEPPTRTRTSRRLQGTYLKHHELNNCLGRYFLAATNSSVHDLFRLCPPSLALGVLRVLVPLSGCTLCKRDWQQRKPKCQSFVPAFQNTIDWDWDGDTMTFNFYPTFSF